MSDEDEIGEKSDMTRIEDLSEFLHQEDPDVNAALNSDEPPSTEDLPGLDDLEDEEETLFDSEDEDTEESPSFDLEDDSDEDYSFDSNQDEESEDSFAFEESDDEDNEEDSSNFSEEDDSTLDFSENDTDSEEAFDFTEDDDDEALDFTEEDSFNSTDEDTFESSDSFENNEDESDNDFNSDFSAEDEGDSFEEETSFDSNDEEDLEDETFTDENFHESSVEESPNTQEDTTASVTPPQPAYIDKSEKFDDVKSFAKNITYGKIASGGNPPFSIILRNIKFEEDVEDIMIILNEHELVTPETETAMKQSLEGGSLLISQISEYAAIYLTHKFRRFDLDVQMGLSDELHPSKSYEADSVGLISKSRINQNKKETIRIDKSKVDIESIIVSTTPTLENYKIIEYLGIISDFIIVDEEELSNDQVYSESHEREAKGHVDQSTDEEDLEIEMKISQSALYSDLSDRLKPICIKKNANAVVGVNYQITPLSDGSKYKISCSGSAVWIVDNN